MKNKLQPTRTSFSRNLQYKKAPRWLSKLFHFGTENRADQLKKPPCMNLVPAVQHISGSQLFQLNQKLALIMNLLLFDLRTERPFEIGKLSFFFQIQDMAHQCDWISTYFTP